MPAATHVEKEGTLHQHRSGCCSGATRRSSRRATAARSCGSCTTCSSACSAHYARLDGQARLADPEPRPGTTRARRARRAERRRGAARDQRLRPRRPASWCRASRSSRDDGSTACGCWIYSGVYADGVNQARRREPGDLEARRLGVARVGLGLARQPPRALLARQRRPGRAARGPSASATSGGTASKWTGYDVPDFPVDKPPDYVARRRRRGHGRDLRQRPVHHAGRRPRLAVLARRAARRAAADALRAARVAGDEPPLPGDRREPGGAALGPRDNPVADDRRPALPGRGHHLPRSPSTTRRAGCRAGCRGWPSCSPRCSPRSTRVLAREHGIEDGGWMTISSPRGGDRGARQGDRPDQAAAARRRASSTRSACPGTGASAARRRATRPTTSTCSPATPTSRSRSRRPSSATCARAARRRGTAKLAGVRDKPPGVGRQPRPSGGDPAAPMSELAISRPGAERMGFFTDTTTCIGCKACEVACKQWNDLPSRRPTRTGAAAPTTTPAR